MSLVSVITNYGYPVIVSDRAFSMKNIIGSTHLPTTNSEIDFNQFSQAQGVYTLGMKSIIVKDILCVGFVGIVADIKEACNNIQDYFIHRPVTHETVLNLFEEYDFNQYKESSIILVLGRPDLRQDCVGVFKIGNWDVEKDVSYQEMLSAGTGAVSWSKRFHEQAPYHDTDNKIIISHCLNKVILLCMQFIVEEKQSLDNLLDGWGGGFDLIYYADNKFQRLNQLTYAFWRIDISNPEQLNFVSVMHNSYDDGNLIIRNHIGANIRCYIIPPMNIKFVPAKDYPTLIQSKTVVSCVDIYDGKEKIKTIVSGSTNLEGLVLFQTLDFNGELGYAFEQKYTTELLKSTQEFL